MKIKSSTLALLLAIGVLSSEAISLKSSMLTHMSNKQMVDMFDEQEVEQLPVQDDSNAEVAQQQTEAPAEEQQQQEQETQPSEEQSTQTEETVNPPAVEQEQQVQETAQIEQGAEAEAQAQAEAEAEQQAQAELQARIPIKKQVVSNVADTNQAAAVAAAANELFPDVAKMKPAEKKAYLAKKAKEAQLEKQRLKEKEERENPTVDENGEHIQTVEEAKVLAAEMQAQLEAGEAAVEEKIAMHQAELEAQPAEPEPVSQVEDDGHVETVEEVKARMASLQKGMDEGLQATDQRVQQMAQENSDMPDFGALANMQGTISHMGKMRKIKQMNDLATKLGVEVGSGEEELSAQDLTATLMQRAKEGGKTDEEINVIMSEE